MINYPEIYWTDQCQFCMKSLNTSHCIKNQGFMQKLQDMYPDYLGTLEFECDFFTPDREKLKKYKKENAEVQ